MESLKLDKVIDKLIQKQIDLFSHSDFRQLFPLISPPVLSAAIKRLIKTKTISRIEKGKYQFLLSNNQPHQYKLANFIYQPSYVSLETALSFYGIIDQFTYQITSITTKKAIVKTYLQKAYSYAHLSSKLFTDYHQQEGVLIATPNKALFDYCYLAHKGYRSRNNLGLINLSISQKKQFISYVRQNYGFPKLYNFINKNL